MIDIKDLEKTLWSAADKMRSNMDAAEYKHVVLGLIFLKYISDAFNELHDALPIWINSNKQIVFKVYEAGGKRAEEILLSFLVETNP